LKPSFALESQKRLDVICVVDFAAKEVTEFFELEKNATHVMFRKRMNVSDLFTEDFSKARFKKMGRNFFKFGIEIFNKYETKIDHKLCRMRFILNSIFS